MTTIPKPPPPAPTFGKGKMAKRRRAQALDAAVVKDCQQVLAECGYPERVLILDFETYFSVGYGLKNLSTIEYIMDPQFEVLGLSILDSKKPRNPWFLRGEEMVETYLNCLRITMGRKMVPYTVVAQNARFDLGVLAYRYGIHPRYFIDTTDLARHWNARQKSGLAYMAEKHKLEVKKGDTQKFKGWTNRTRYDKKPKGPPIRVPTIRDDEWPVLESYALDDVRIEWELFKILLPKLSNPVVELEAATHTLELFTKPTLLVDYDKAAEIRSQMEKEIDKVVSSTGHTREDISGANSFENILCSALEAAGDNPAMYRKPAKNKAGRKLAIANPDPERALLEKHPDDKVRGLMAAKGAIATWPMWIKRVDTICNQARAAGGKLSVSLKYHAAHTGRWGGSDKQNLQNLGSRGHPLVSAIRTMLVAPPEHTLVIADASQIEARVLAWLAGQDDLVYKFAMNRDVYCEFASLVLGWTVRKPNPKGPIPSIEAKHKWARNAVGKIGVLGGGYMGGVNMVMGLAGGLLDEDTAQKLVDTYRESNTKIVQFWKDIDRAFTYTASHHQDCEMPRGLHFTSRSDCDVVIVLPSGRELKYHDVRVEPRGSYGSECSVFNPMKKAWDHVYGGSLTENVVQAMSRDILWGAVSGMEKAGYHVALHIHDELVAVVPEPSADVALNTALALLRETPAWASGCPLNAEGLSRKTYGNH